MGNDIASFDVALEKGILRVDAVAIVDHVLAVRRLCRELRLERVHPADDLLAFAGDCRRGRGLLRAVNELRHLILHVANAEQRVVNFSNARIDDPRKRVACGNLAGRHLQARILPHVEALCLHCGANGEPRLIATRRHEISTTRPTPDVDVAGERRRRLGTQIPLERVQPLFGHRHRAHRAGCRRRGGWNGRRLRVAAQHPARRIEEFESRRLR